MATCLVPPGVTINSFPDAYNSFERFTNLNRIYLLSGYVDEEEVDDNGKLEVVADDKEENKGSKKKGSDKRKRKDGNDREGILVKKSKKQ